MSEKTYKLIRIVNAMHTRVERMPNGSKRVVITVVHNRQFVEGGLAWKQALEKRRAGRTLEIVPESLLSVP